MNKSDINKIIKEIVYDIKEVKYWVGSVEKVDDFGDEIIDTFIDGKTKMGTWATMTPESWKKHGIGKLGMGYGQMYKKQPDNKWLKVKNTIKETIISPSFSKENIEQSIKKLKDGIKAPYVHIQYSTLGGEKNISIIATISMDPKETWEFKILENSRYIKLYITNYGTIELISQNPVDKKFRKTKFSNLDDAINKINKFLEIFGNTETTKFEHSITEGAAETIVQQLGNRALFMMGAKNLAKGKESNGDEFLVFKIGRNSKSINYIKIIYNYGPDLYTIQFIRVRGDKMTIVKEITGVFFDEMHEMIEDNTGLRLSL